MENVASFLQYGSGPSINQCGVGALRPYEPTEQEIKEREAYQKKQAAKDLALCTISTAEKLVMGGRDIDTAFAVAEEFVETSKRFLALKTESVG